MALVLLLPQAGVVQRQCSGLVHRMAQRQEEQRHPEQRGQRRGGQVPPRWALEPGKRVKGRPLRGVGPPLPPAVSSQAMLFPNPNLLRHTEGRESGAV